MTFAGSIAVLLIWFILSAGIGFAAMFYGPGAVTFIAGLWLGLCGSVVHLLTTALKCRLHWSYAGITIGAVTIVLALLINNSGAAELTTILFLFVIFSVISYIIFPIADYAMRTFDDRENGL